MQQSTYQGIRDYVQPGDIMAFGGKGAFSNVIKMITLSTVSHVGIIIETKILLEDGAQPGKIVDILESTTLNGKSGVQRNRMSDRVDEYAGDMWWLPLRDSIRQQMDMKVYFDYCLNQIGRPYDMLQAILAGLHLPQPNGTSKLFCSEVAVACMKVAGVKELRKVNPPQVTPMELCAMALFQEECVQIKGNPKEIRGFNSRAPWMANL